jgi:regulator of sirC expression with transglutaminase-like and TPR domain
VAPRQLLARVLANLKGIYWQREQWEKVVAVINRLLALTPGAGAELRDRGLAWTRLGEVRRGLADWERYLREFPSAADHEQVKGELRRVRHNLARLN